MYKIGVIGAGHMGMALLDGVIRTGAAQPSEIYVYEKLPERAAAAQANGFIIAENERAVYDACAYLLLAVLPQEVEAVLQKLAETSCKGSRPVICSIVSGLGSVFIRGYLGEDTPVINIVPNIALSVGMGATVLARTSNVPDLVLNGAVKVLDELGLTAVAEERLLTEIIPANGCAPGYAFYMIDAVARAVAERGVDYALAVRMTAAGFAGAARMVLESEQTPDTLLARVCSPGGLTAQAIDYFNSHAMSEIIAGGVNESIRRGYELARS